MPRKIFKPEQIINRLRTAEVELSQGKTVVQVCKKIGSNRADLLSMAQGIRRDADRAGQAFKGSREGKCQAEEACGQSIS